MEEKNKLCLGMSLTLYHDKKIEEDFMKSRFDTFVKISFLLSTLFSLTFGLTAKSSAEEGRRCPTEKELREELNFGLAETSLQKIVSQLNKMPKEDFNQLKNMVIGRQNNFTPQADWYQKGRDRLGYAQYIATITRKKSLAKRIDQTIDKGNKAAGELYGRWKDLNKKIIAESEKLFKAAGIDTNPIDPNGGDLTFKVDSKVFEFNLDIGVNGKLLLIARSAPHYILPRSESFSKSNPPDFKVVASGVGVAENGDIRFRNVAFNITKQPKDGDEIIEDHMSYDELLKSKYLRHCRFTNDSARPADGNKGKTAVY